MLAGPYCGLLLADLGAEVIKIEPPTGDIAREASPHFVGEHNAYFASLNRNKRGVVIDLQRAAGQAQLHELCRTADAPITTQRPSEHCTLHRNASRRESGVRAAEITADD